MRDAALLARASSRGADLGRGALGGALRVGAGRQPRHAAPLMAASRVPPAARARRWGRAAAPGGCPRRGCRPRRARRRGSSTRALALGVAPMRAQAARAAVQAQLQPEAVSMVSPARPGTLQLGRGLQAQRDLCRSPCRARRRVERRRRRPPAGSSAQPSREASQPTSSIAGDRRVGVVADRDHAISRSQLAAQRRRVERRRHPLAPGRRAQPREVDDVGASVSSLARSSASRADGLVDRVEQHRLRERQQRVDDLGVAVRRPQQRRQVGDDERVGDRQQVVEVPSPSSTTTVSCSSASSPRLGIVFGGDASRARRGACASGS